MEDRADMTVTDKKLQIFLDDFKEDKTDTKWSAIQENGLDVKTRLEHAKNKYLPIEICEKLTRHFGEITEDKITAITNFLSVSAVDLNTIVNFISEVKQVHLSLQLRRKAMEIMGRFFVNLTVYISITQLCLALQAKEFRTSNKSNVTWGTVIANWLAAHKCVYGQFKDWRPFDTS